MRIAHQSTGEPPSPPSSGSMAVVRDDLYDSLLRRCQNLEASHGRLSDKLRNLRKRQLSAPNGNDEDDDEEPPFQGRFSFSSPHKSILDSLGHALHVFRASSGEIIYWNRSAENLYGWREYEVVGRRCFPETVVSEEHYLLAQKIVARVLRSGESWSGQFPVKKRSGKIFTTLVTKSPLYEDGELAGVIVVACDARVVNSPQEERRDRASELKNIKWNPKPPIAPDIIAASVSNLAAKVFAKLQIKGSKSNEDEEEEDEGTDQRSGDSAARKEKASSEPNSVGENNNHNNSNALKNDSVPGVFEACELFGEKSNGDAKESEDEEAQRQQNKQLSSSDGSVDHGSRAVVDCVIHWEDLHMGDEIGQGFYAVVYRGIWNGSDVAIKVYLKNEYSEGTLQDYKKEIDIMKRLRHPNVLLFMGAAYSQERLAIITEFLPRGSLFKTLHKNNQSLDIRRRVRMALDVARGMNYLHRRNPPIVHRDLKSSNLLVDKNWTVKVGDFGLSKLKNATFLTTKSGRGTPQWMAPEVLRNEPSNEKSDIYSFGVILWELMTESIPWSNLNPLQVVGIVGFMDRRLELPEKVEPRIASIILDCWKSDPAQRPSFADIIRSMSNLNPKLAPVTTQKSAPEI